MNQEIPQVLKPISWLIGRWESDNGKGQFPNLSNFSYNESIEFRSCGVQPLLIYTQLAYKPETGASIHVESGFLRAGPDNTFSFCLAHDTGFTTIEEGKINPEDGETKLVVRSEHISLSKSFVETHVLQTERTFERDGDILKKRFGMATAKMPELKHHLEATFKLVQKTYK